MLTAADPAVEPLPAEEQLAWAVKLAARYSHAEEIAELDPIDPDRCLVENRGLVGVCDDCGRHAGLRYRLGKVAACRVCATARLRAAVRAERPLSPPATAPWTAPLLPVEMVCSRDRAHGPHGDRARHCGGCGANLEAAIVWEAAA